MIDWFIQFICLLIYFFLYLFIYLLILYLFQWQQNIRRLILHFLFNSLCTCVHSNSINYQPSFLISLFHPSMGGEFMTLSSRGMVYPYPSVIWVSRLRKVSIFLFFFFYVFCCFVLQRVTFCFWLFFKYYLATTTGADACLCLSFDII